MENYSDVVRFCIIQITLFMRGTATLSGNMAMIAVLDASGSEGLLAL